MRILRKTVLLLLALGLTPGVSPALRAQGPDPAPAGWTDISQRLEEMQKEIKRLESEITELKKQQSAAPAAPAAPAEAPAASSGLSKVLGSTSLSGFVDGYYGYNFNQPHSRVSSLRAFDGPSNQFSLNMIELILDKPPEAANSRLGFRVALGYGQAMNVVNASDPGGLGFAQYLKEAYFSYLAPVGKGLQVDFGKFVTPHGAEVIETKDNWNYSRGLLFTYAIPFYHFGFRTKYAFNDKVALTGFVVNGWNNIVDNNTGKTVGVSLGWNPSKKFGIIQNYMAGPEQAGINTNWRQLSDTTVTVSPTERLSFIVNYDYGRGDQPGGLTKPVFWTGIAGYVRYVFNEQTAVATRYEWFNDHDGFTTGTAQRLNEFTTTFERRVARNLITRLEFRRDFSNQPSFLKGDAPVKAQNTLAGGLVYVFDTRESQ